MPRIEKTVFISYRRTNLPWALCIYQYLTSHGYDVFFDYQSIDSGNFERVILDNIRARAHFIIILTPSALEKCKNPGDWLRREIETAIDEKRNIVPIMLEGFDFGSPSVKEALTGKLAALSSYNGLSVPEAYALEAMDRLRERYLKVALSDVVLPVLQEEAQEITNTQKKAANEAAPVKEEQLTAQTWFERGYVFQEDKNLEEALRCYSEAIRLDPNLIASYNNLGNTLTNLKRYAEAEKAYNQAIKLNSSYALAYSNLGLLLHENLKRYAEAEKAYNQAIELKEVSPTGDNPSYAIVFSNLGNLLCDENLKRYDEAEAAYRKAIEINPSYASAYYNLGILLRNLKRYDEAEVAYRKAIEINPSYASAYYNLTILLRVTERAKEALPFLETMIEIDSEDFSSYLGIASIRKAFREAVPTKLVQKARKLIPENDFYNRACLESVCDNFDLAFEYLKSAAQKERFNPAWAWEDPDLQWIRSDPRFTEIVGPQPEE